MHDIRMYEMSIHVLGLKILINTPDINHSKMFQRNLTEIFTNQIYVMHKVENNQKNILQNL